MTGRSLEPDALPVGGQAVLDPANSFGRALSSKGSPHSDSIRIVKVDSSASLYRMVGRDHEPCEVPPAPASLSNLPPGYKVLPDVAPERYTFLVGVSVSAPVECDQKKGSYSHTQTLCEEIRRGREDAANNHKNGEEQNELSHPPRH